jgi:hypothetical protein
VEESPIEVEAWAEGEPDRLLSIDLGYAAARRAIRLARAYRREPGSSGRRERECLAEVARLRKAIAQHRRDAGSAEGSLSPSVRKAAASPPSLVGRRAG